MKPKRVGMVGVSVCAKCAPCAASLLSHKEPCHSHCKGWGLGGEENENTFFTVDHL